MHELSGLGLLLTSAADDHFCMQLFRASGGYEDADAVVLSASLTCANHVPFSSCQPIFQDSARSTAQRSLAFGSTGCHFSSKVSMAFGSTGCHFSSKVSNVVSSTSLLDWRTAYEGALASAASTAHSLVCKWTAALQLHWSHQLCWFSSEFLHLLPTCNTLISSGDMQ